MGCGSSSPRESLAEGETPATSEDWSAPNSPQASSHPLQDNRATSEADGHPLTRVAHRARGRTTRGGLQKTSDGMTLTPGLTEMAQKLLIEMFRLIDHDGSGRVNLREYKHSFDKASLECADPHSPPTTPPDLGRAFSYAREARARGGYRRHHLNGLLYFFIYLEGQGLEDQALTLEQWLQGMANMGTGLDSRRFEEDLRQLLREKRAAQPQRVSGEVGRGTWRKPPRPSVGVAVPGPTRPSSASIGRRSDDSSAIRGHRDLARPSLLPRPSERVTSYLV